MNPDLEGEPWKASAKENLIDTRVPGNGDEGGRSLGADCRKQAVFCVGMTIFSDDSGQVLMKPGPAVF